MRVIISAISPSPIKIVDVENKTIDVETKFPSMKFFTPIAFRIIASKSKVKLNKYPVIANLAKV
jgi:hypothetical protein